MAAGNWALGQLMRNDDASQGDIDNLLRDIRGQGDNFGPPGARYAGGNMYGPTGPIGGYDVTGPPPANPDTYIAPGTPPVTTSPPANYQRQVPPPWPPRITPMPATGVPAASIRPLPEPKITLNANAEHGGTPSPAGHPGSTPSPLPVPGTGNPAGNWAMRQLQRNEDMSQLDIQNLLDDIRRQGANFGPAGARYSVGGLMFGPGDAGGYDLPGHPANDPGSLTAPTGTPYATAAAGRRTGFVPPDYRREVPAPWPPRVGTTPPDGGLTGVPLPTGEPEQGSAGSGGGFDEKGILDWLFGRKPLEGAAGKPDPNAPPGETTDQAYARMRRERAARVQPQQPAKKAKLVEDTSGGVSPGLPPRARTMSPGTEVPYESVPFEGAGLEEMIQELMKSGLAPGAGTVSPGAGTGAPAPAMTPEMWARFSANPLMEASGVPKQHEPPEPLPPGSPPDPANQPPPPQHPAHVPATGRVPSPNHPAVPPPPASAPIRPPGPAPVASGTTAVFPGSTLFPTGDGGLAIWDLIRRMTGMADQSRDRADALATRADMATQPSMNYYEDILSGDPARLAQALGPAFRSTAGQFDAAQQSAATSLPRGGGRNAVMAEQPFKRAAAMSELVPAAQAQAAQGAGQIGVQTRGQDLNAIAQQIQAATGLTGPALDQLVKLWITRDQKAGAAGGLAGMLGSLLGSFL